MTDSKIKDASLVSDNAKASQAAAQQCEIVALWNRFVIQNGGDADYSAKVMHARMNNEARFADMSDVDARYAASYVVDKYHQCEQTAAEYKEELAKRAAQQAEQNLKEKTEKKENVPSE